MAERKKEIVDGLVHGHLSYPPGNREPYIHAVRLKSQITEAAFTFHVF